MTQRTDDEVRTAVRDHYGNVAKAGASVGCSPGCCSGPDPTASLKLGYAAEDVASVPEGSDMGLGCGNPQAIAALKAGESVLDLGAGGGFDCFLAAKQVGAGGRVIGVDMTPEMVTKARRNAERLGSSNVEFRLGEIEHLPLADATIDVVLSNCVINLSPDKAATFREAFRVLKPGGRLAISDVVATQELPSALKNELAIHAACIAGAATIEGLRSTLVGAGFSDVVVEIRPEGRSFISEWLPGSSAEQFVASATIQARKADPSSRSCCGPTCCTPEA
jgi:arsenite methyltransferase